MRHLFPGLVIAMACAAGAACLAPAAQAQVAAASAAASSSAQREVVSSADQLPRRTIRLGRLPSAYLTAPRAELLALADKLEANLRADLARYEIRDDATRRDYVGTLLTLAQFRRDWAAVPALVEQLRALQDKPGPRATTGTLATILAEQQTGGHDAAWVEARVRERYGALDWAQVANIVKQSKSQFELLNPELTRGVLEQELDVMARNMGLDVPESVVGTIVGARLQNELIVPLRGAVVAGLQAVIDRHAGRSVGPDIWTPRQFSIARDAKASAVAVAIWDSGVDLALFETVPGRGIAFDRESRRATDLLRPLGDAAPRWPELKTLLKGAMDLRAALDTADARRFKQVVSTLPAERTKGFIEDMALVGLYTHGTHVAGIAVAGNPFARVYTASMLWDHRTEPMQPTEARSRRTAAAYREIVEAFKANGVRVVNMSWRYGASLHEAALAWHNVGAGPEDRKRIARELFAIERDALYDAIASAPDILFVAGSGNEDNSADFEAYIPAGLSLPNLITVGAVDPAGEETSFSTFGETVVVHANGFEVDSVLPGGERVKFSGTSMASPQVANLAAKLFALQPSLTVARVKDAILRGADTRGRVKLANPRRSAELLGLAP